MVPYSTRTPDSAQIRPRQTPRRVPLVLQDEHSLDALLADARGRGDAPAVSRVAQLQGGGTNQSLDTLT